MPAHSTANDVTRRPSCLVVAPSGNGAKGGVAGLLGWTGFARGAMDVTLAMDASDPDGYVAARRACARWGVPFVPLSTPDAAAAVVASHAWDYVEVRSAADAALLSALRSPATVAVLTPDGAALHPDAAAAADLVLCRSGGEAEALARALPGTASLRVAYELADDVLLQPDSEPRRRSVLAILGRADESAAPLLAAFRAARAQDPSLLLTLVGADAAELALPVDLLPATERLGPIAGTALAELYRSCGAVAVFPLCSARSRVAEALLCGAAVLTEELASGSEFDALPGIYLVNLADPEAAGRTLLQAVDAPPSPRRRDAAQARFGTAAAGARKLALLRAAAADKAVRALPRRQTSYRATLQVTPFHPGRDRPAGGSDRHVDDLRRAVRAVAGSGAPCRVLFCGHGEEGVRDGDLLLSGNPAEPDSFDPATLDTTLASAAVVHVHQCLTRFGLFVAARARMLGRRVVGTDHGAATAPFLAAQPHLAGLFDVMQTCSAFGDMAALNLPVRTVRIPGPVDDGAFPLAPDDGRDLSLVVAIGPVLPHKGIEAVIDALPPFLRLVVAGVQSDPAYLRFLQARAAGRNVRFEPELDDAALLGLMARAGLCVDASTHMDYLDRADPCPDLLGLAPLRCMCTGMPALVTTAGALAELGVLAGCRVAAAPDALAVLLRRHADGTLPWPPGHAIRAAAVAGYGLRQFGERYLAMVEGLPPCAC